MAELRDEGGVGVDLLQGDDGEEGTTDEQIKSGDDEDSAGKGDGEGSRGIADLPGDFAGFPPSAETEEGADGSCGDGRGKGIGAGASRGEREHVGYGGVSGGEGPDDKRDKDGNLEPVERGSNAAAEAGAEVIDQAGGDEDQRGQE